MSFSKLIIDMSLSLLALIVLAPVMILIAVWIKLSSRGPVFYIAPRAGYKGQTFGLLKFRTMYVGAGLQGAITAENDARVIPLGKFLRLFRLDELPQLVNILAGEMSIVGPRPEDAAIVRDCYTAEQRRVFDVLPGLTGFPQVRFFPDLAQLNPGGVDPEQHYRESVLPMRLTMDLEYVRKQSLWLDLHLMAATLYLIVFKSWYFLWCGERAH